MDTHYWLLYIGDILAGSVGTFVAWNQILTSQKMKNTSSVDYSPTNSKEDNNNNNTNNECLVLGCWMASCFTKCATAKSFDKKKRSMTAPDVIEEIGDVVDEIASSTITYTE